jgi:hypothetical protein
MLCPKCNSTVTKMPGAAPQRGPSLLLGCAVMFVSWLGFVFGVALLMGFVQRFLFSGNNPVLLSKILAGVPLTSGILILCIGLVVYSRKNNRHRLLVSELQSTWSCPQCGESWK